MTPTQEVACAMLSVHDDPATPAGVKTWLYGLMTRLADADQPDPRFTKGHLIPPTVGAMADEYAVVRAERLRMEKAAAAVKSRETELYNTIMSTLDESVDTGASGDHFRVQRVEKDRPGVQDWPSLWAHIQKTGDFDLLQKRLSDKAVKDHLEAGDVLPGVEMKKVPTLSFHKIDS